MLSLANKDKILWCPLLFPSFMSSPICLDFFYAFLPMCIEDRWPKIQLQNSRPLWFIIWWTIRIDDKMWTDEQGDGGSVHSAWADELVRIFREGQLEFRGHCANFMRFPSPGPPFTPSPPPNNPVHPATGCDRTKCNLIRIIKDEKGI